MDADVRESAKSESRETTFKATNDVNVFLDNLKELCANLSQKLVRDESSGRTVTLKIKHEDFKTNVKSKTLTRYINDETTIFEIGRQLLLTAISESSNNQLTLRLIGIRMSNFKNNANDQTCSTSSSSCSTYPYKLLSSDPEPEPKPKSTSSP